MKKAEYMEEYVGEEYDAVYPALSSLVSLSNCQTVEGLIHITNLLISSFQRA